MIDQIGSADMSIWDSRDLPGILDDRVATRARISLEQRHEDLAVPTIVQDGSFTAHIHSSLGQNS